MTPLAFTRLAARLAETWFRRPATPNRVVMDLTRRCNLRCTMCRTWRIEPGHELSPDEVRATMGWEPRVASDLATTPEPTAEELRLIREELDPEGMYTK